MPLTPNKIAHISAKQASIMTGRTQPVTLTLKNANGTTSTLVVNGIWRQMADFDPELSQQSLAQNDAAYADIHAMFLASDITLQQLRSVVIASTANSLAGLEPGHTYRLTSIAIKGIQPGGDRYLCTFNRQR